MDKKIWLIGSKGMLGKEFKNYFIKNNIDILKSDIELDISIKNNIEFFLEENPSIEWIINCSAYTDVDKAETKEKKANLINHIALQNISEIIKSKDIKLIHFSTDYVFDGKKHTAYNEKDKCNPISVYGKSKHLGELEIIRNLEKYYIFRISWLYGIYGNNFVKTMLNLFDIKNEISVIHDQIGSPTYTKNLVENIFILIKNDYKNYGIYHYQDKSEGISWYDFANKILEFSLEKKLISKNVSIRKITSSLYKSLASRPEYSFFDTNKVVENLYFNINNYETNLLEYLNHYRK